MHESPTIAIVGATGAVGRELLSILADRQVPASSLRLLASSRSAGKRLPYLDGEMTIAAPGDESFAGVDVALFSAGGSTSREVAPRAVEAGATVIDNSSAFRMSEGVPLVVPEVNGDVLDGFQPPGVIANPNCSTIIALMAVTPLHRVAGVKRMIVSTYQAASGGGAAMMHELEQQAREFASGERLTTEQSGNRPYIFNLFSHNSTVGHDGYNEEERKMVRETHKMWADDSVKITATCVRVPVLRAHCESINLSFERPLSEDDARAILHDAPGVRVIDNRDSNQFPEPVLASGEDDVLVGRIRGDLSQAAGMGLELFVAGDQLRKGAALNAIQVMDRLMSGAVVRG